MACSATRIMSLRSPPTSWLGCSARSKAAGSLVRLGRHAQVRPQLLVALGKALGDLLRILDGGADDDVVALLPVDRGGHLVAIGELQRVDDPQDLLEVAAGARGVGDGGADLLVRID